jgi:hypothetical protein
MSITWLAILAVIGGGAYVAIDQLVSPGGRMRVAMREMR